MPFGVKWKIYSHTCGIPHMQSKLALEQEVGIGLHHGNVVPKAYMLLVHIIFY